MACGLFGAKHYLNQRWTTINWKLRNTFQCIFNQYTTIFKQWVNMMSSAQWRLVCLCVEAIITRKHQEIIFVKLGSQMNRSKENYYDYVRKMGLSHCGSMYWLWIKPNQRSFVLKDVIDECWIAWAFLISLNIKSIQWYTSIKSDLIFHAMLV